MIICVIEYVLIKNERVPCVPRRPAEGAGQAGLGLLHGRQVDGRHRIRGRSPPHVPHQERDAGHVGRLPEVHGGALYHVLCGRQPGEDVCLWRHGV